MTAGNTRTSRDGGALFDAFQFDRRAALVVGAAHGRSAAAAQVLREAGAKVTVIDRPPMTLGAPRR